MRLINLRASCITHLHAALTLDTLPSILSSFASLKRKSLFVSSKRK